MFSLESASKQAWLPPEQRLVSVRSLTWMFPSRLPRDFRTKKAGLSMFLILAVVLVLLWVGGFTVMHISSFFIHLLLLFAVISLVLHFVTGRTTA